MFSSISFRMSNHDHLDNQPQFLIGPDMPTDPASLLDEARQRVHDEDAKNKESVKLARRLFIAFILITILGVVFYIVMPIYGLKLSPTIPILSFLAIFIGAVMTGIEEQRSTNRDNGFDQDQEDSGCNNDGCPTGMCSGPRPLQMFRDKKPPSKH